MNHNDLYFAKIHEDAIIPSKRDEDAGYDFYPCFDKGSILINPLETVIIPTGIAVAMDSSKYLQLHERSSLAKKGIKISAGIIDSGYRGEILVCMYNTNTNKSIIINKGDKYLDSDNIILIPYHTKICQGIIHESHKMNVCEISYEKLMDIESDRKSDRFGSTD